MTERLRTIGQLVGLVALAGMGALGACGTDAVGVEACREIESARCARATECAIQLKPPNPAGDPVAACKRFYLDACLHGVQSGKDPTAAERKACVDAVSTGSCDVVREPQRAPGCAFIVPAASAPSATSTETAAPVPTPAPPAPQPDGGADAGK